MAFIRSYKTILPKIHETAFVAETAAIIGDVVIGAESSVWFGCTLRGDVNNIIIGERTNIQDHTIIHVSSEGQGTYVGNDVTIGHAAVLHACTIGNQAFIGMQACVMDDAVVEDRAMVAAGALVTPGKRIPSGQLWGGSPARYMRDLTKNELAFLQYSADRYVRVAKDYRAEGQ